MTLQSSFCDKLVQIARRAGVKQVGLAATGGTSNNFAARRQGRVARLQEISFPGRLGGHPLRRVVHVTAEIRTHRERVRKTIAAAMDAVAWQRTNRGEAVKMIASRYKISQSEAERSYETMIAILSSDGSIGLKKVRGYLSLLREERPIPETLEPEKLVDFPMLPSSRESDFITV